MEFLCGAIRLAIVLKDTRACKVLVGSSRSRVMFAPETGLSSGPDGGADWCSAHVTHLCRDIGYHCDCADGICNWEMMCICKIYSRIQIKFCSVCTVLRVSFACQSVHRYLGQYGDSGSPE